MGQSERYRLRSHIATVIEHLIKLQASPASDPRNGWKISVRACPSWVSTTSEDQPQPAARSCGMILDETPDARQDVAATLQDYGEPPSWRSRT